MVSTTKSHPENSDAGRKAKADATAADTSTADVQAQVDADTERGFRGVEVDPTPNEAYTVAGVTGGAPTPETDDDQAETVRRHLKDVQTKAAGVAGR